MKLLNLEIRFSTKLLETLFKKLKDLSAKKEAKKLLPSVVSMLDKLVKNNIIHANKAANLKSKLTKQVSSL